MFAERYKTAVLTLVLAGMIITGCSCGNAAPAPSAGQTTLQDNARVPSSPELNAQEYLNTLKDTFHSYAEANKELTEALGSSDIPAFRTSLDKMKEALSGFENINPPSTYADRHEKLIQSLSGEYEYMENCSKFMDIAEKGDAITEDDKKEVDEILEKIKNAESEFPQLFLDIVKEVKADLDK